MIPSNQSGKAGLQKELDTMLGRKLKSIGNEFLTKDAYIRKWGFAVDAEGTVPYDP